MRAKVSTPASISLTERLPNDPQPGRLLEVGYIARAHGIVGDVIVVLTTDRTERVAPGTNLVGRSDRFDGPIDLVVTSSRPHQDRWIVHFEGWATRDAAESLRGTGLLAEPLDDPETIWVHELIGSEVYDQAGVARGRVTSVEANPASDLMVLETGSLVPVHFITAVSEGRVDVDVPKGLFGEGEG